MIKSLCNLYFSPAHSSAGIAVLISARLAKILGCNCVQADFTLPSGRERELRLGAEDLLLLTFPVYAGRIPQVFARTLQTKLHGERTPAIALAVYGNRAFDDSLAEAQDLLSAQGFEPIAAIAAIAQHTFAPEIGAGRPDAQDKRKLEEFADRIAAKLQACNTNLPDIPGNRPYVMPKPLPALTPLTSDACNYCGICARDCPVGVIDCEDEHVIANGCILCTACVKFCPQKAKSLPADFLAMIRTMLASKAAARKEPELFI